jgi:hypothetical protein
MFNLQSEMNAIFDLKSATFNLPLLSRLSLQKSRLPRQPWRGWPALRTFAA